MAKLRIRKPDDSGEYYLTTIECDSYDFTSDNISSSRKDKDPVHSAISEWWRNILSYRHNNRRNYRSHFGFNKTFTHLVKVNGCPVLLSRQGIRYEINGKSYNLSGVSDAMARLTFKSCFESDPAALLSSLYSALNLPENVKYCIENRVPYHWIELEESIDRIEVRLNCRQISDKEIGIEISDGVWGTMTIKQLDVFCNYYHHAKERGSWKNTSPMELYYKTLGKLPTSSDLEVMKSFLKQNRTQDLVEERALELVNELLEQYSDRLEAVWENEELVTLYVRGKDYDWMLTNNQYKSDIQKVSTWVWQTVTEIEIITNEEGITQDIEVQSTPDWQGPICIDNMTKGSSLGDQFAARALALLNDRFTITIVNTINRYLNSKPNINRVDVNGLR